MLYILEGIVGEPKGRKACGLHVPGNIGCIGMHYSAVSTIEISEPVCHHSPLNPPLSEREGHFLRHSSNTAGSCLLRITDNKYPGCWKATVSLICSFRLY